MINDRISCKQLNKRLYRIIIIDNLPKVPSFRSLQSLNQSFMDSEQGLNVNSIIYLTQSSQASSATNTGIRWDVYETQPNVTKPL